MTNWERIQSMSKEEFIDYIFAVFTAGKWCATHDWPESYENYKNWLDEEADCNK